MRTAAFDYDLPSELIASRPPDERDAGRLCVVGEHELRHARVRDLPEELEPGDLLVLNETKVRKARAYAKRESGGRVELLFLEQQGLERQNPGALEDPTFDCPVFEHWTALGRANRPLRARDRVLLGESVLEILEKLPGGLLSVRVPAPLERLLDVHGHMPLPPYLGRAADAADDARYQTVFARDLGSAAAPTAGLHLTPEMLGRAQARGVRVERLTLHVGLGTFKPVEVDDLDRHPMHEESIRVPAELGAAIAETRRRGGRVVAVGTTVVRALESAADPSTLGHVLPVEKRTRLLIQPGYVFRVVDAMLTNFHMPRSTLLALVSAFAGYEQTMSAYGEAVRERYRFLSYGDAMWIPRCLTRART